MFCKTRIYTCHSCGKQAEGRKLVGTDTNVAWSLPLYWTGKISKNKACYCPDCSKLDKRI